MPVIQELIRMHVSGISMFMHVLLVDRFRTVDHGNRRCFLLNFATKYFYDSILRIPPSGEIYHSTVMAGPANHRESFDSSSSSKREAPLKSFDSLPQHRRHSNIWNCGDHCTF